MKNEVVTVFSKSVVVVAVAIAEISQLSIKDKLWYGKS